MRQVNASEIKNFVELNIGSFHEKRLLSLQKLKLGKVLLRKNPYLFKAKNVSLAQNLVEILLDAHLSSQEETIFGEFLEGLSIFVCGKVYGGNKSSAEGIDLEFEKEAVRYIVAIKSGPNWGNSSQIERMKDNFRKAKRILRTNSGKKNVVAVNGCCYGKCNKTDKGEYLKYCGQQYWEFVTGDKNFYLQIIEPLGHKAKEKNEQFVKSYPKVVNQFTKEFIDKFCHNDGAIDWEKLVKFNSSMSDKMKKDSKNAKP